MVSQPTSIPKNPGVYIFRDAKKKPLYIGKAANLRRRLASYFMKHAPERIIRLRREAAFLDMEITPTEFDALVREAELIKTYRPKFNVLMRDDKSYYYVVFSKELFPRIMVTHQPPCMPGIRHTISRRFILGPFTEGKSLFSVLKMIRASYPYCTCKRVHEKPCLNAQMGRCFGFCCLKHHAATIQEKRRYAQSLFTIQKFLSGSSRDLLTRLEKDMQTAALAERFEDAARLRDAIRNLQSIIHHRRIIEERNPFIFRHAKGSASLRVAVGAEKPITRIEGYDISHISGQEATASMVVFSDGRPDTSRYRRFRIRFHGISDGDMLKEVIRRRMAHAEWRLPDMMLIDGGMPQLRAVSEALREHYGASAYPFILAGISKARRPSGAVRRKATPEEILHVWKRAPIRCADIPQDAMHILQAVRDESHRFAKKYHAFLRSRAVR